MDPRRQTLPQAQSEAWPKIVAKPKTEAKPKASDPKAEAAAMWAQWRGFGGDRHAVTATQGPVGAKFSSPGVKRAPPPPPPKKAARAAPPPPPKAPASTTTGKATGGVGGVGHADTATPKAQVPATSPGVGHADTGAKRSGPILPPHDGPYTRRVSTAAQRTSTTTTHPVHRSDSEDSNGDTYNGPHSSNTRHCLACERTQVHERESRARGDVSERGRRLC